MAHCPQPGSLAACPIWAAVPEPGAGGQQLPGAGTGAGAGEEPPLAVAAAAAAAAAVAGVLAVVAAAAVAAAAVAAAAAVRTYELLLRRVRQLSPGVERWG